MIVEMKNIGEIKPYAKNPRRNDQAVDLVARSIQEFGFNQPIVVDDQGVIVVGHTRLKAAKKLGLTQVPVLVVRDVSQEKLQAYRIADNKLNELADWDDELLISELQEIVASLGDADLTGFDVDDLLRKKAAKDDEWKSLSDKFLVPPFSILDARQGPWAARKRIWKDMGIRSEEGRESGLTHPSEGYLSVSREISTSVFDPVLTETLYLWYSPLGGHILDPFAGGSVRGIVAQMLGRSYTGIDLRAEQIQANQDNWADLQTEGKGTLTRYNTGTVPELNWIQGDSLEQLPLLSHDLKYDLVFTCPPYADLEVYSDDPKDISNMDYKDFLDAYSKIIKLSANRLKDNRFFVIVVGEVRGHKHGAYYNFISHTIQACEAAGLDYYNEAIYITPTGTMGMRTERPFVSGRKLGKHHQNALIFTKGDGKKAKETIDQISDAFDTYDHTGQLTENHEKILVFSKGDPKKAVRDLGPVEVDSLDTIMALSTIDKLKYDYSHIFKDMNRE